MMKVIWVLIVTLALTIEHKPRIKTFYTSLKMSLYNIKQNKF